ERRTHFTGDGRADERQAGDGGLQLTGYDANGFVASQTDELGRTTTYTADAQGYVTLAEYPDGSLHTYVYQTGHHALVREVDELGRTTTYTYTAEGQVATVTAPDGGVTTLTWDAGLLQTVRDPLGGVATAVYDAQRQLTGWQVDGAATGTYQY